MIRLNPECLLFETGKGEWIPCSAELVTIELIGPAAHELDPHVIRQAASAVLHYFKEDLQREAVSVAEFSAALEKVLVRLGYTVLSSEKRSLPRRVQTADLRELAPQAKGFELAFFSSLRAELRRRLRLSPEQLRFDGLRACVKMLSGAKHWNGRCQQLSDQIVGYLRACLESDAASASCEVIIR